MSLIVKIEGDRIFIALKKQLSSRIKIIPLIWKSKLIPETVKSQKEGLKISLK